MRRPVDKTLIGRFCRELGQEAKSNGRVYFTGDAPRLLELFQRIESELYRFPAVDPPTLRRRVEALAADS
jgi:hypothetical protein